MRKRVPYRENPGCARKKHLESPASGSTPPRRHRIRARPIFIPGRKIAAFTLTASYKDGAKIYTPDGQGTSSAQGLPANARRSSCARTAAHCRDCLASCKWRVCAEAAQKRRNSSFAALGQQSIAERQKSVVSINNFISIYIDFLEKPWYCIAIPKVRYSISKKA